MLPLKVAVGESIMIGDDIRVMVVCKDGDVNLGIDAPRHVSVDREIVYRQKLAKKLAAARAESVSRMTAQGLGAEPR